MACKRRVSLNGEISRKVLIRKALRIGLGAYNACVVEIIVLESKAPDIAVYSGDRRGRERAQTCKAAVAEL